jgi:hypothetical protein
LELGVLSANRAVSPLCFVCDPESRVATDDTQSQPTDTRGPCASSRPLRTYLWCVY